MLPVLCLNESKPATLLLPNCNGNHLSPPGLPLLQLLLLLHAAGVFVDRIASFES
jgi:hypothetical protein